MSKIEFVSYECFPEDEYIKEIVYICLEKKYRVAYIRKVAKNGGLFWSVATVSALKGGKKEYHDCFIQDSNFLEKDIKTFLENREWEKETDDAPYMKQEIIDEDKNYNNMFL